MVRARAALESFLETCDARREGLLRRVVERLRRELPEELPADRLEQAIDRFVLRHDERGTRLVCQRLLNYLTRPRTRVRPRTASPVRDSRLRR
jgi:hypothetical protein